MLQLFRSDEYVNFLAIEDKTILNLTNHERYQGTSM
jgi:hypothetical protein